MNGGRIKYNKADNTIQVSELEVYANYMLTLSEAFENVAWRIKSKIISITIDPNQFKLVEIPVSIINEVSGVVYLNDNGVQKGLGRIIIQIFREDLSLTAKIMTEPDGSFNVNGLSPGKYSAAINPEQLEKLHMKTTPWSLPFIIEENINGDFVDGLRFVLAPL